MALIKVTHNVVNYWDRNSSKMLAMFNTLKAIVTGEEYKEVEDEEIKL